MRKHLVIPKFLRKVQVMDEETLSHFKVKSKPWTRKYLDIKTSNKKD